MGATHPELQERAKYILDRYIVEGSECQVNIPSTVNSFFYFLLLFWGGGNKHVCNVIPITCKKKKISFKVQRRVMDAFSRNAVDIHTFNDSQKEIYALMERDNFSRFKKSEG